MASRTAWIITKDNEAHYTPDAKPGSNQNAVGLHSRDWAKDCETPVTFRMGYEDERDGSNPWVYYGKMGVDADYEPLDDFGTGNIGATVIQIKTGDNTWETL